MLRLLLNWLLSALALLIVAHVVPGFHVSGFGAALLAKVTVPGPLTLDHAQVNNPGGSGNPSSVTVPFKVATAGRVMV